MLVSFRVMDRVSQYDINMNFRRPCYCLYAIFYSCNVHEQSLSLAGYWADVTLTLSATVKDLMLAVQRCTERLVSRAESSSIQKHQMPSACRSKGCQQTETAAELTMPEVDVDVSIAKSRTRRKGISW